MTQETMEFATATSSLGLVLVARSARGITAVLIGDDGAALEEDLKRRFPLVVLSRGQGSDPLTRAVVALIERPAGAADIPLDLRGSDFQQRVWTALRGIPPGSTCSYAQLAARLGRASAARAVAGACAANHLAVLVPCHRVVRGDGGLSGYRWGVERKRELLAREAGRRDG